METDISDRLELLYEPPQDGNIMNIIDLVFVHGTLGDHISTWTHPETKTYWPRDLLPKDFPHVRILAFKYSPTVEDFFPHTTEVEQPPDQTSEEERVKASSASLNAAASDLITAIAQFRRKSQRTPGPIILLGHSRGGLVCIKSLFEIKHPLFESVFSSLEGLFFFGTPFMEHSDDKRWRDLGINLFRLRDLQEGRTSKRVEMPRRTHRTFTLIWSTILLLCSPTTRIGYPICPTLIQSTFAKSYQWTFRGSRDILWRKMPPYP